MKKFSLIGIIILLSSLSINAQYTINKYTTTYQCFTEVYLKSFTDCDIVPCTPFNLKVDDKEDVITYLGCKYYYTYSFSISTLETYKYYVNSDFSKVIGISTKGILYLDDKEFVYAVLIGFVNKHGIVDSFRNFLARKL